LTEERPARKRRENNRHREARSCSGTARLASFGPAVFAAPRAANQRAFGDGDGLDAVAPSAGGVAPGDGRGV